LYGSIVCSNRQLFLSCLWISRLFCNYIVKAQFSEGLYDTKHLIIIVILLIIIKKLQLDCHRVAVVILHAYKI